MAADNEVLRMRRHYITERRGGLFSEKQIATILNESLHRTMQCT